MNSSLNVMDFLARLRKDGIELRAEGDKLVVNAPKGAVTEAIGDEIRRNKQAVLAFLQMGADIGSGGDIPKAKLVENPDRSLEAPLSFGQSRLYYIDQFEPGLSVFNVPIAFWLKGEVDPSLLHEAINDLIARHAAFRTTLRLGRGGAVQHIAPSLKIELPVLDLRAINSVEEREKKCKDALTEHARASFDLATGPLIRALLVRMDGERDSERNVLLITMHHVVTDGWSQDVMERELLALYDARKSGTTASLPAPALQYADYAAWLVKASKEDPERQKRIAYWNQNLKQPLPILELPTTFPRTPTTSGDGDTAFIELSAPLVGELTALGRRDGATLFMVMFAAYVTLLHRVSGQDEIVVGTPIANRGLSQMQDVIGYFANTVALRVDLSGAPSFRELLKRVREVCVNAFANQDIFFEEITETHGQSRDLSRAPVFQTMFTFEDTLAASSPAPTSASSSLRVTHRDTVHALVARNDLSAWVSKTKEDNLLVTFEYPTDLFDRAAIDRLLDQYRVLLRSISEKPDAAINRLTILSEAERKCVLDDWNATKVPLPALLGAHQLIERQVDATPDKVAVAYGDVSLTYRDLDERANKLAHHFVESGVALGALIGVFLDRSAEMLVVLLAVMKVGGTYVPLDPEYPRDRVALMIGDSGLTHVVTTTEMASRLPLETLEKKPELIRIDEEGDAKTIATRSASRLPCKLKPGTTWTDEAGKTTPSEHPCYVIYTSGSTGVPKGVMVPHRALINFLVSMAKKPGIASDDVLVAITTLSFDISGLEMYLPLVVGAKIVIADADDIADDRQLRALVERSSTTIMQGTPAMWRLLIGAGWEGSPTRFKALCGGEAFPMDLVGPLLDRVSSLWNVYGPTETTIWSTAVEMKKGERRITIGKPIDNTYVYILDANGEPTPVGVPGELVIGGAGVSLGYLNRAELTASKFVVDPFHGEGSRLMYKTGDVAAWRADGQIVFTGRVDHQVKVRGYRIEAGEIEAVLCEHEDVARSVVIVREDRPGDARLVAYVIFKDGKTVTATDLRKHLRRKLPDYMIPQHVIELSEFPLTPAGKVNRKALPPPVDHAPTTNARAPETPNELVVAKIWKEVLNTETVTALDNFFDIGGHSLLSMIAVAKIQAETGVRISPRDLLLSSLEQIAALLGESASARETEKKKAPPPQESKPTGGMLSRLKGKIFG